MLLASTATGAVLPVLAYPSSAGRLRWVTAGGQRFVEVALRSAPEEDLLQCHYEVCRALDPQRPRLGISPEPCTSCGQPLAMALAVMGVREHPTCAPTATRSGSLHSQPLLSSAGAL